MVHQNYVIYPKTATDGSLKHSDPTELAEVRSRVWQIFLTVYNNIPDKMLPVAELSAIVIAKERSD